MRAAGLSSGNESAKLGSPTGLFGPCYYDRTGSITKARIARPAPDDGRVFCENGYAISMNSIDENLIAELRQIVGIEKEFLPGHGAGNDSGRTPARSV